MAISLPPPPASSYHPLVSSDSTITRSWSQWFNQVYVILQEAQLSAPNSSTYVIATSDPLLPNAQVLSNLAAGYLQVGAGGTLISTGTLNISGSNITNGTITSNKLVSSGVTPGTYGTATQVSQVTIDSSGLVTNASNVTITNVTGNAASATQVFTASTSTNAAHYPLFVNSNAGGNASALLTSGLSYNPSTGVLTTSTFSGALSGTATNTTNIGITNDTSTNATMYPVWVTANTGNLPAKVSSTKLSFNPSTGILTVGASPVSSLDVATKIYVDSKAATLAVTAATTTSILATYNNGTSGVGATLTYNSTGVQSIDGVALNGVGTTFLIKNQSPSAPNGVYTLTTAGAIGVAAVLTRATNYDEAAEMNATGLISIISGAQNIGTYWYLSQAVTTIGTDPVPYVQSVPTIKDSDLIMQNITTNNVTSSKHGFAPISPADSTKFLNGAVTPAFARVKDSDLQYTGIIVDYYSYTYFGGL